MKAHGQKGGNGRTQLESVVRASHEVYGALNMGFGYYSEDRQRNGGF